ncbi:hypothetical protein WJX81_006971 [Elliptochloris bilobata]|uniref:Uncharacterized protein n=1 Tax=Elliptochloris bilobata TaxID=381761 RepID=A0AAW1RMB4_9CHLO
MPGADSTLCQGYAEDDDGCAGVGGRKVAVEAGTCGASDTAIFAAQDGAQVCDASLDLLEAEDIPIDCSARIRKLSSCGPGICTNFLADGARCCDNGIGYTQSLVDMKVGTLRYPGGEKSDTYCWAPPPWTDDSVPHPVLTRTGGDDWPACDESIYDRSIGKFVHKPLDFDEFMGVVAATGADPYLVLNYDSANKPGERWNYEQLRDAAESWVAYIVRKGYQVKHFEFSNESNKVAYGHATAAQYTSALLDWAPRLKAIMPNLLLGANGPTGCHSCSDVPEDLGVCWWQQVLGQAASVLDFVVIHSYPLWDKDFSDYADGIDFQKDLRDMDVTLDTWCPEEHRTRLRYAVTECAAIDWGGKWQQDEATLGHGLVAFEIMVNALSHPRVDACHFWNTRWKTSSCSGLAAPSSCCNALRDDNSWTPNGTAITILGQFFRSGELIRDFWTKSVRAWAVLTRDGHGLTVIMLHCGSKPARQVVRVSSYSGCASNGQLWTWQAHEGHEGEPHEDRDPIWGLTGGGLRLGDDGELQLRLPPVSISVVAF